MPTPTGDSIAPPEPAVYSIQGLTAGLLDGGSGILTAQISWSVVRADRIPFPYYSGLTEESPR